MAIPLTETSTFCFIVMVQLSCSLPDINKAILAWSCTINAEKNAHLFSNPLTTARYRVLYVAQVHMSSGSGQYIVISVLPRHWTVVGSLYIKNAIFIGQPCFYTHNNQFSMLYPTVVVGGVSECWVLAPSAAHRG